MGVGPHDRKDAAALGFGSEASLNGGCQLRPLGLEAFTERLPGHDFLGRGGFLGEPVPFVGAVDATEPHDLERLSDIRPMRHDIATPAVLTGFAREVAAAQIGEEDGAGPAQRRLFGGEGAGPFAGGEGLAMALAPGARRAPRAD